MARGRRWKPKSQAKRPETVRKTLSIVRLNDQAEGVAELDGKTITIPFTLEYEEVVADVTGRRGKLIRLTEKNDHLDVSRRTPECPIYTKCGGCKMQHFVPVSYANWKRHQVIKPFMVDEWMGGEKVCAHDPLVRVAERTRRRATFAAKVIEGSVTLGFMEEKSHRIEPMDDCLLLTPALNASLPALRALGEAAINGKETIRLRVLDTETGLDVQITGLKDDLSFDQERKLMDLAGRHKIARLTLDETTLIEYAPPTLTFGKARVVPPPGAFTQSTASSEAILADLVLNATEGKKYIVDLFAGIGTFALRLAERARVHVVEGDGEALAALEKAARATPELKPVKVEKRDLFRRPLMAKELDQFDAIVLDPPRAGAETQAQEIAKSKVETVVYVSCAPKTFHRDASILQSGGYILTRITPVDQFLYSPHIEVVGIFKRG